MALLSNGQILRVCVFALLGLGCVGGIVAIALSDVLIKELYFIFLGVAAFFFFGDAVRVVFDAAEVAQNQKQNQKVQAEAWIEPETEEETRRRNNERQAGLDIPATKPNSSASASGIPLLALP